jgi:hypothetical protein
MIRQILPVGSHKKNPWYQTEYSSEYSSTIDTGDISAGGDLRFAGVHGKRVLQSITTA